MSSNDTIVAIATAPGRGALGIVRVSGPAVPELAKTLLGELPAARRALLSPFRDAQGNVLDAGLALYFPAPASFTGEHVLELHGHGGAVVLDSIVRCLLDLGCRSARPGEFSERAFLNGKIDIAQAEAIADLIDAGSAAAARAAVRSMQGEFSACVHDLQAELTELRAFVEAGIDFPDEQIDGLPDHGLRERFDRLGAAFATIFATARQGALLRDGITVVIAGRPNAGKSSLLNRLVGDEVAIVTDQPGTTRDVLKYRVTLDGLPVTLIDTAGLRLAADAVEAEGVRRARREIEGADRVLYLIDAQSDTGTHPDGAAALPPEFAAQRAVTRVFNKIDLVPELARVADDDTVHYVSAKTGAGLRELRAHLQRIVGYADAGEGALTARRRHLDALQRARERIDYAASSWETDGATADILAEELRLAQLALGEITGEFASDDLLGEIFASFCIGK